VAWLEDAYDHTGLGEKIAAGFWACVSLPLDLLLRLSGPDLFGSLLDEAIRRTEAKEPAAHRQPFHMSEVLATNG